MLLATFMIGLREGMEAALVIGILVAFVRKSSRPAAVRLIWIGVASAIVASLLFGAIATFGRYGLSFKAQELIGGSLSLLAVAMITWMVFWMMKTGHRLKSELETSAGQALMLGTGSSLFWLAFVTVGREGLETTIMLWAWIDDPVALVGALTGILVAVGLGYLLFRGMLKINLRVFFAWTGAFLIVLSAGVLAYGITDLQEAAFLPGPYSGAPITPTNFRTGEVLTGFTTSPFWMAAYPFGWAFDVSHVIDPTGFWATFLKGSIGFMPQMSWLAVTAWALYLSFTLTAFLRRVRNQRPPTRNKVTLPQVDGDKQQAALTGEPRSTSPPA